MSSWREATHESMRTIVFVAGLSGSADHLARAFAEPPPCRAPTAPPASTPRTAARPRRVRPPIAPRTTTARTTTGRRCSGASCGRSWRVAPSSPSRCWCVSLRLSTDARASRLRRLRERRASPETSPDARARTRRVAREDRAIFRFPRASAKRLRPARLSRPREHALTAFSAFHVC
jgi:hypothetical protein